jgi:hypothetical protein
VRVVPDPPQTPMLHLLLRTGRDDFLANVRRLAKDEGIWTWPNPRTADPDVLRVELSVGDATCEWQATDVRAVVAALVE